jgi:hypothetical protein
MAKKGERAFYSDAGDTADFADKEGNMPTLGGV